MKKTFSIFCITLIAYSTSGQLLRPYFDHIKEIYGYVYSINQDHEGYLWIGTKAGLYRHDGTEFKSINSEDSLLLRNNNYIQAITEDSDQKLWLGSKKGLYVLNKERSDLKVFKMEKNGLSHSEIRKIVEGRKKHTFWIATYGGGLNLYDEKTDSFTYFKNDSTKSNNLPGDKVNDILLDSKNRLWAGCEVGGLGLFDTLKSDFTRVPLSTEETNYTVSAIAEDENGVIWVGTWSKGLYKYEERIKTLVLVHREAGENNPKNTIRRLVVHSGTTLFLGTLNGLGIFNTENRSVQFFEHKGNVDGSISGNSVWSLFQDREGILWVGTLKKGMCKWDKSAHKFKPFLSTGSTNVNITKESINTAYYSKNGNLWLSTESGEIYCLETNTWTYKDTSPIETIKNRGLHDIAEDRHGNLWFVSDYGIFRYNPITEKLDTYMKSQFIINGEEMGGTYSCSIGEKGDLYIVGWSTGLMVLPVDKQNKEVLNATDFIHYTTHNSKMKTNILWQVISDGHGNIWMNSKQGVFVFIEESKEIKALSKKEELSLTMCLHKEVIYGYDPLGKIYEIHVNEEPKLILDIKGSRIEMCKIDELDRMWLSSTDGLSIRSLETTKELYSYNSDDGLPTEPITTILFIKVLNKVVLGATNGVSIKDINDQELNRNESKVRINDILLFGHSISFTHSLGQNILNQIQSPLTFDHTENGLTFLFSPMALSRISTTDILYKLDSEEQWHTASKSNPEANYPYLSSGKYALHVKTMNSSGYISPTMEVLNFQILSPWWRTWWAIIAYFILGIILIRLAFSYSLISIKARNKLKMERFEVEQQESLLQSKLQFFTNISHEIKTPLTLILGPIDRLIEAKNDDSTSDSLFTIKRNAEHLHTLFEELLEFRKIESGISKVNKDSVELVSLINDIILCYKELCSIRFISIVYECNFEALNVFIDKSKTEKAIHNLISNAIKNTPENGEIIVTLNTEYYNESEVFQLTIEDSGSGIPDQILERIFERFVSGREKDGGIGIGLALVKQIVELQNGSITAKNTKNGALFTMVIPLLKAEPDSIDLIDTSRIIDFKEDQSVIKETILLVEDNKEIQNFIVTILEEHYSIYTANNGKEGIDIAKKLNPQLIISDVMMPTMDGLTFCNYIKSDLELSHIPFVLLTARSSNDDLLEGLKHSADGYLTKPFNNEVLLLTIKNLFQARKSWIQKFQLDTSISLDGSELESLDEKLLRQTIHLIQENISDSQMNVTFLSNELGMHRSNLSKKLKGLTGFSPIEFIRHIRLKRAYELLESDHINVSEVAYEVGYNNPKYFSTSFKAQFGISPSETPLKKS